MEPWVFRGQHEDPGTPSGLHPSLRCPNAIFKKESERLSNYLKILSPIIRWSWIDSISKLKGSYQTGRGWYIINCGENHYNWGKKEITYSSHNWGSMGNIVSHLFPRSGIYFAKWQGAKSCQDSGQKSLRICCTHGLVRFKLYFTVWQYLKIPTFRFLWNLYQALLYVPF